MPTKIGTVDKSELINAALPTATKTYTVISHEYIIDTINDALTANGFTVKEEVYRCTLDAKVAHLGTSWGQTVRQTPKSLPRPRWI